MKDTAMQSHPSEAFIDKFSRQLVDDDRGIWLTYDDRVTSEETEAIQEVDTGIPQGAHFNIFDEHIKILEWAMEKQISVAIIRMYHNEDLFYHKGVPTVTRGSVPTEWNPNFMSPEDSLKVELFDPLTCKRTFCMEYSEDESCIVAVLTQIPETISNSDIELVPYDKDYREYRKKQWENEEIGNGKRY